MLAHLLTKAQKSVIVFSMPKYTTQYYTLYCTPTSTHTEDGQPEN